MHSSLEFDLIKTFTLKLNQFLTTNDRLSPTPVMLLDERLFSEESLNFGFYLEISLLPEWATFNASIKEKLSKKFNSLKAL